MSGLPKMPDLGTDAHDIAVLALKHCRLPAPDTVALFSERVFPTIRDSKRRIQVNIEQGLMFDSNATPRWALFWAHGIGATGHPKGWTIAHVWAAAKDPQAYTNLANLVLMPECLGSLSDKNGPLCDFLKYHAYSVYGWKPSGFGMPTKPQGFDDIEWNYFDSIEAPQEFVNHRVMTLNNQRVKALRPLMGLE